MSNQHRYEMFEKMNKAEKSFVQPIKKKGSKLTESEMNSNKITKDM